MARVSSVINQAIFLNLISGQQSAIGTRKEQTTDVEVITHKSHNKFYFGKFAQNKARLWKTKNLIRKKLEDIRFSIPWFNQGKYFYVVLFKTKKGLYVMDDLLNPIDCFLEGFLSGNESSYPGELWHGLIGSNLFFSPFQTKMNYVLYYVNIDDLVTRALERGAKKKKKGTLLSQF